MNRSADVAVTHIDTIRNRLLAEINQRRQECLDSLSAKSLIKVEDTDEPPPKKIARLSIQLKETQDTAIKLQQEIAKLSGETSEFVLKRRSYFQRVEFFPSETK